MLRISKNTNKIVSIQYWQKPSSDGYTPAEIDNFIIIPGVTFYNHVYSKENWLFFDTIDSYIVCQFQSESDLERFFTQIMREIKLNQISNLSIDIDKKTK